MDNWLFKYICDLFALYVYLLQDISFNWGDVKNVWFIGFIQWYQGIDMLQEYFSYEKISSIAPTIRTSERLDCEIRKACEYNKINKRVYYRTWNDPWRFKDIILNFMINHNNYMLILSIFSFWSYWKKCS